MIYSPSENMISKVTTGINTAVTLSHIAQTKNDSDLPTKCTVKCPAKKLNLHEHHFTLHLKWADDSVVSMLDIGAECPRFCLSLNAVALSTQQ